MILYYYLITIAIAITMAIKIINDNNYLIGIDVVYFKNIYCSLSIHIGFHIFETIF